MPFFPAIPVRDTGPQIMQWTTGFRSSPFPVSTDLAGATKGD
ncbi:MAG: hypothetical protein ACR5K9_02215 [Wolbachia sp.]